MKLLGEDKVPAEQVDDVIEVIASAGGPKDLAAPLEWFSKQSSAAKHQRRSVLETLASNAEQRGIVAKEGAGPLAVLLHDAGHSIEIRVLAARLAGLWKVETLRGDLMRYAIGGDTAAELRVAAIEAVARLEGADTVRMLLRLIDSDGEFKVRAAAVRGLAALDTAAAAKQMIDLLGQATSEENMRALVEPFLSKKGDRAVLAAALGNGKLSADAARTALAIVRSVPGGDQELVKAITAAGNLGGPRLFSPTEISQILDDAGKIGDPHRGEEVYRRADMQCLKCHAIGGAGGQVGPDLISLGASAQPDYILESLIEPSKKIKENYNAMLVIDDDGRQYAGIRMLRSGRELILRDAEDRQVVIISAKIESEEDSPTSLMPTGLVDTLTHRELVDLVKFLSELGKQGDFAVGRTPVVRRWQTPANVPESLARLNRAGLNAALGGADEVAWTSAYCKVNGSLPMSALTVMRG